MSGFEIVGVVLGSLPLVIAGLEHYADGIDTLSNMFEYEEVLRNLISTFITIEGIYHNSCKELLDPLLLPESDKVDLLSITASKGWDDVELGQKLQARLGTSYQPYMNSVRRLNKRVELFKKKLELSDEMKPKQTNKDSARERLLKGPWRRIRVGFGAEKLEKLLRDIEQEVARITKLTRGAFRLEVQSSARVNSAELRHWRDTRDHTRRIFEVLVPKWRCKCDEPHRASLQLSGYQAPALIMKSDVFFQLLFSFDLCSTVVPWNWRDVTIRPMKMSTPAARLGVNAITARPALRSVSFASLVDEVHNIASPTNTEAHQTSDITCLCTALTTIPTKTACIGSLSNADQGWQQRIFPTSIWKANPQAKRLATLRQLILNRGKLSPRKKYEIASSLASSVLELYSTPWMSNPWTLDDLYFVNDEDQNQKIEGPFVSKIFSSGPTAPADDQVTRQQPSTNHNPMVFALGVLLLELCFGPLESRITSDDLDSLGQRTLQTQYLVANRLVSEIQQFELPGYANAVTRCVCGRFDALSTSLDNDQFQQCFRTGVVEPLSGLLKS